MAFADSFNQRMVGVALLGALVVVLGLVLARCQSEAPPSGNSNEQVESPLIQGRLLVEKGLDAKASGDPIAAKRKFLDAIAILQRATGEEVSFDIPNGFGGLVAFSPDSKQLATAAGQSVFLWDMLRHHEIARIDMPFRKNTYDNLPPGRLRITSIGYCPRNDWFATALDDGSIVLWDTQTLKPIKTLSSPGGEITGRLNISQRGDTIAAFMDIKAVRTWDVAHATILSTRPTFVMDTGLAVLLPDRKTVLAELPPGSVQRWDVEKNQPIWTQEAHTQRVDSLAVSPDGKIGASGSWDHKIVLWDIEKGLPIRTLEEQASVVHQLAFSPDGETLVSASWDDRIGLWDVSSGKNLSMLHGCHGTGRRSELAFSPDGKWLVVGSGNALCLWDLDSRRLVTTLEPHAKTVTYIRTSANDKLLHFAVEGGWITTVDIAKARLTSSRSQDLSGFLGQQESGHPSLFVKLSDYDPDFDGPLVASPDGAIVASILPRPFREDVSLWDAHSGKRLPGFARRPFVTLVSAVGFAASNRILMTAYYDGSTLLSCLRDGSVIATMRVIPEQQSGYVFTQKGEIELWGSDADDYPICRVGPFSLPFESCQDRFVRHGLLSRILENPSCP